MHTLAHMWKTEDNMLESVLSFLLLGPRSQTQVSSLHSRCPYPLSYLIQCLKFELQQEIGIKGIKIGNEVKLSLFASDMILYLKYPIESSRKLSDLINTVKLEHTKSMFFKQQLSYIPTRKKFTIQNSYKKFKHPGIYLTKEEKN